MPGMENPDWFIQRLKPAKLYTATRRKKYDTIKMNSRPN
jgi:hypothetical protein